MSYTIKNKNGEESKYHSNKFELFERNKNESMVKRVIRRVLLDHFNDVSDTKDGFVIGFNDNPKFQTKIIILQDLSKEELSWVLLGENVYEGLRKES